MTERAPVTLRRYVLPSVKGEGWAVSVLGSDGYFSTVSDFGNYAFRWAYHGMPDFRLFLLRVKGDYVASKFGSRRFYYGERTLKAVREHLLTYRRTGGYTREFAREEWDRPEEFEDLSSEVDFGRWLDATRICDAYELAHYGYEPQLVGWCDRILPRLKEVIRAELAAEAQAVEQGQAEVAP